MQAPMVSSTSTVKGPGAKSATKVGKFIVGETLGEGSYSVVKRCIHEDTREQYALKVMSKDKLPSANLEKQVRKEVKIMQYLRHPHVVTVHDVLMSERNMYIVMELVNGVELYDEVIRCGRFDESTSRRVFQQVADAVAHCHTKGVFHRDLKPENVLVDAMRNVKVCDFGMGWIQEHEAAMSSSSTLMHTQVGTPQYMAPEVLRTSPEGYRGDKVDIWSLGMILYVMLSGSTAFPGDDTESVLKQILGRRKMRYPPHFKKDVRALLDGMLQRDPEKRITMQQIREHPWFLVDYVPTDSSVNAVPNAASPRRGLPSVGKTRLMPEGSRREEAYNKFRRNISGRHGATRADRETAASGAMHSGDRVRRNISSTGDKFRRNLSNRKEAISKKRGTGKHSPSARSSPRKSPGRSPSRSPAVSRGVSKGFIEEDDLDIGQGTMAETREIPTAGAPSFNDILNQNRGTLDVPIRVDSNQGHETLHGRYIEKLDLRFDSCDTSTNDFSAQITAAAAKMAQPRESQTSPTSPKRVVRTRSKQRGKLYERIGARTRGPAQKPSFKRYAGDSAGLQTTETYVSEEVFERVKSTFVRDAGKLFEELLGLHQAKLKIADEDLQGAGDTLEANGGGCRRESEMTRSSHDRKSHDCRLDDAENEHTLRPSIVKEHVDTLAAPQRPHYHVRAAHRELHFDIKAAGSLLEARLGGRSESQASSSTTQATPLKHETKVAASDKRFDLSSLTTVLNSSDTKL
eukprot:CAMPEP_0185832558 /NCGR_PEP_ID=MMETSP1353-20130828/2150_1 /TAXON_ID=1077150 /ORGANISM="Erythrolobus australicus, Strain CCMP3124" /LENGTH=743 /DNA_ID=CAMNT_0028530737 /DNA_START=79 /DNA_END=2310 /DNA_ORIENTATION=-